MDLSLVAGLLVACASYIPNIYQLTSGRMVARYFTGLAQKVSGLRIKLLLMVSCINNNVIAKEDDLVLTIFD